jgi:hypothetical protein
MVGETYINSQAALASQAEGGFQAVFEFLAISAGTVGIGWWTGARLGELFRAGRAGAVTRIGVTLHAETFFHRPGDAWRTVRLLFVLISTAAASAIAVSALRAAGGDSPVYGLFSAVVSIGAAALTAFTQDPVGDHLKALVVEEAEAQARVDALTAKLDQHITAVRATDLSKDDTDQSRRQAVTAVAAVGHCVGVENPHLDGAVFEAKDPANGPMDVEASAMQYRTQPFVGVDDDLRLPTPEEIAAAVRHGRLAEIARLRLAFRDADFADSDLDVVLAALDAGDRTRIDGAKPTTSDVDTVAGVKPTAIPEPIHIMTDDVVAGTVSVNGSPSSH